MLASLLALEHLFREDASDGTLEQYVLSGQSLTWLLLAKTIAHWLLTGLPLTLMAPWPGVVLGVPLTAATGVMGGLALGTWTPRLLGSTCPGLPPGVWRGWGLLSRLLPFTCPRKRRGVRWELGGRARAGGGLDLGGGSG